MNPRYDISFLPFSFIMNEFLIFPLLFLIYAANTVTGCESCGKTTKYAGVENLITCPNGNIEYINGEKYCCEITKQKDCYKILSPWSDSMSSTRRRLMLFSDGFEYGPYYTDIGGIELRRFLRKSSVKRILFIPYALSNYRTYFERIKEPLINMGFKVDSIHNAKKPVAAINSAQAIYVGGGNTFRLLQALYDKKLMEPIRRRVMNGMPYFGVSAGSNVAAATISTTNDMPILHPHTFKGLKLIPININPHYSDPDPNSGQLETRDYRINQYHEIIGTPPVLALRDGSFLHVEGNVATLKGTTGSKLFVRGKPPRELDVGDDLSFLLK